MLDSFKGHLKEILLIFFSIIGLTVYLNWNLLCSQSDSSFMGVRIATADELLKISEGKEEINMVSDIKFNGSPIAYDTNRNMLLIPQDLSEEYFEGEISATEGKLYFVEDDEGFLNKLDSISDNHLFKLYWVTETQVCHCDVYFTGMPVMNLTSDVLEPDISTGVDSWTGDVWVYDQYHDSLQFQQDSCDYHERGASSMAFPKTSYKINLDHDKSFLGMRKDDDWILNSLYDDVGLIHNKLSYSLWQEIASSNAVANDEGINMEYVEVFVNNQYRGVYGLMERVDAKQLSLNKNDVLYMYHSWLYLNDSLSAAELADTIRVKYPKDYDEEVMGPIQEWTSLFGETPTTDYDEAASIISLENVVDYDIFVRLLCATDNLRKNTYLAAMFQNDGSYRFIKIPWDLNMSWGNTFTAGEKRTDGMTNHYLKSNITKDDVFTDEISCLYNADPAKTSGILKERWNELRNDIVTTEHIQNLLSEEVSYLQNSGAYTREESVWSTSCPHYKLQMTYDYIEGRITFLDEYYEKLYEGSN